MWAHIYSRNTLSTINLIFFSSFHSSAFFLRNEFPSFNKNMCVWDFKCHCGWDGITNARTKIYHDKFSISFEKKEFFSRVVVILEKRKFLWYYWNQISSMFFFHSLRSDYFGYNSESVGLILLCCHEFCFFWCSLTCFEKWVDWKINIVISIYLSFGAATFMLY